MSWITRPFLNLFVICFAASAYDFQWVTTFPGASSSANAIALDPQTNSFVAGNFSGAVNFGATQLVSAGDSDVFIAKLDPAGHVTWATSAGGTNAESAIGIAVASDGTLFVSGSFIGTATFGALSLTNTNTVADAFLARLNSSGQFLWARHVTNAGGASLALAPIGQRVWLACSSSPLLRAYDFAGNSVTNFIVSNDVNVSGLAVDTNSNVYLNGTFHFTANFGTTNLTGPNDALYTAKVSPNGVVLWATTINDSHRQEGHGVALSPDGAVVSCGRIDLPFQTTANPSTAVLKNSPDGTPLWTQFYGFTTTVLTPEALAVDGEGNSYTVGHMQDSFFNPDPRQGTPVIAWTSTGWLATAARTLGPTTGQDSFGHGLTLDGSGNLYIAGHFNGTALFGTNVATASPPGANNAYVAKLGAIIHPTLDVQRATNFIALSWPAPAVGFRLQQTTNLPAPVWNNASGFPITYPTTVTNRTQVFVPPADPRGFFRLSTQ